MKTRGLSCDTIIRTTPLYIQLQICVHGLLWTRRRTKTRQGGEPKGEQANKRETGTV